MVETNFNLDILKKRYVDPIENAVVETNVLRNNIKFDNSNKTGESYVGAVLLRNPQAFTYAGSDTMNTAFAINSGSSSNVRKVELKPNAILLENQISYGLMASATSSETSFSPELRVVFEAMTQSHDQEWELTTLYGGQSLGIANAVSGASSPTADFQISIATWSPHIWGPKEGAYLDAYSDSTLTTKVTANGPATLNSVDIDNRKLNITFANGTDYTAAAAAAGGSGLWLVQYGVVGNVADGLVTTLVNSAAGSTVYGVNTSSFGYMRATSRTNTSAALTFAKVSNLVTNASGKGGMGDLDVLVNLYSFTDIMNDQAALRRYTSDNGGEFTNGADRLTYYGSNGGKLNFICNPMLKAGEALILDFADWRITGATMPTFNIQSGLGMPDEFAYQLPGNAGWGIRRWSQTAPYCARLARQTYVYGIVNTSGPSGGGT